MSPLLPDASPDEYCSADEYCRAASDACSCTEVVPAGACAAGRGVGCENSPRGRCRACQSRIKLLRGAPAWSTLRRAVERTCTAWRRKKSSSLKSGELSLIIVVRWVAEISPVEITWALLPTVVFLHGQALEHIGFVRRARLAIVALLWEGNGKL